MDDNRPLQIKTREARIRGLMEGALEGIRYRLDDDGKKAVDTVLAEVRRIDAEIFAFHSTPFPAGLWCAACGKWGDHRSGACPTIKH